MIEEDLLQETEKEKGKGMGSPSSRPRTRGHSAWAATVEADDATTSDGFIQPLAKRLRSGES